MNIATDTAVYVDLPLEQTLEFIVASPLAAQLYRGRYALDNYLFDMHDVGGQFAICPVRPEERKDQYLKTVNELLAFVPQSKITFLGLRESPDLLFSNTLSVWEEQDIPFYVVSPVPYKLLLGKNPQTGMLLSHQQVLDAMRKRRTVKLP